MILLIQYYRNQIQKIYIHKNDQWTIDDNHTGVGPVKYLQQFYQNNNVSLPFKRLAWLYSDKKFLSDRTLDAFICNDLKPTSLKFFEPHTEILENNPIGIAYFSSPAMIKRNNMLNFTSWYHLGSTGMISGELIKWDDLSKHPDDFILFLLRLSFALYKNGGAVQHDTLLGVSEVKTLSKDDIQRINYKFVNAVGSLRQKLFYLLRFPKFDGIVKYFGSVNVADGLSIKQIKKINQNYLASAKQFSTTYDVIIPTLGRAQWLKKVLKDLSEQTLKPANVIIIEQVRGNNLNTELDFLLNTDGYKFNIIHEVINQLGACNARNLALENVVSEWVFFADDDIEISHNSCEKALSMCEKLEIDCLNVAVFQKNENLIEQDIPVLWESFSSGAAFVRKKIVSNLRFDLNLEFGYGEDTDFGHQIRNLGTNIFYTTHVSFLHHKAPIGGFRYKHVQEWLDEKIEPKPSPTVLYNILKWSSEYQVQGYKWFYFLKRLKKEPFRLFTIFKQWNISMKWANILLERISED